MASAFFNFEHTAILRVMQTTDTEQRYTPKRTRLFSQMLSIEHQQGHGTVGHTQRYSISLGNCEKSVMSAPRSTAPVTISSTAACAASNAKEEGYGSL